MTVYARPGAEGSVLTLQSRYDYDIGGAWVAPRPADTSRTRAPPFPAWGGTSPPDRALILNKITDRIAWRPLAPGAQVSPEQVRTHGVDYERVDDDCLEKR